jgi:hypothetical protein
VVEDRAEDMCQDVEMLMPREVCVLAPRALQKVINIVFALKSIEIRKMYQIQTKPSCDE